MKFTEKEKRDWVSWMEGYGADKFFDAFVAIAQDAESRCLHCNEAIYLDIVEGCGVPEWMTVDGDTGCFASPETNEDGTAGHEPIKLRRELL